MGFLRHGQEGLNKLREVVIGALRLPPRALLMPPTPPIPFPSPFVSIFFNFSIIYLGRTHGRTDYMFCLWEANKPEDIETSLGEFLDYLTVDNVKVDEIDWDEFVKTL